MLIPRRNHHTESRERLKSPLGRAQRERRCRSGSACGETTFFTDKRSKAVKAVLILGHSIP